jgi:hypothetical protein
MAQGTTEERTMQSAKNAIGNANSEYSSDVTTNEVVVTAS